MTDTVRSAWTRDRYPREGDGVAFDRVVFFSDAVFAIALTLAAVEIGLPEVEGDTNSISDLWDAVVAKGPGIGAYIVAFIWVAVYWRANHRFTMTLRAMNGAYVRSVLLYLALIALLPIPAGLLGEYWQNPLAIVIFAVYASACSAMEVVLFWVADRGDLFVAPLSAPFRRQQIIGSLTPVAVFLLSIPIALFSPSLALLWWVVGSIGSGIVVNTRLQAAPPPDPEPGTEGPSGP
ncbi:MAG: TMEM175 family protein [Candidatus Nanopelagicales bacterium]